MDILGTTANRNIGRAMHHYDMLAEGDRVLVAVSGGVDSLVLAFILKYWRNKAPIHYEVAALYIDNGFAADTGARVAEQLRRIEVPFIIEKTDIWQRAAAAEDGKSVCYHCARARRNLLFEKAKSLGCNKIAFGHHKDDILETFFINLLYAGNISTMLPKQKLFNGRLHLIRPLAYLEKIEVQEIAEAAALVPVKNPCPKDSDSKRLEARMVISELDKKGPKVKANIFAALSNIRQEYLLNSKTYS